MRRWSGEIRLERPPERASVAPRAEPAAGSGAVLAGATVGLIESLQVLSRSFGTRDYSGMVYAIVLYGAAGAAAGLPLIGATALLRVGVGHPLDAARVFTGCFLLVAAALGTMVAAAHGAGGAAGPLPSIGLMSLAAILFWFIVKNALQKTFFGALLRPSVAAGAYLSLLGFTLLFALGTRLNNEARASLTPRPVADALRDRPNLLVLVADGLSARLLDEAPELVRARAFADGATRFDAAFAHSNDPRASIASLLVAAPPCVHGVRGGEAVLPDWADTFPEVLQRHGYTTGAIVTGLDLTASFNFDQGFDTFRFLRPIWPLRMSEAAVRLAIYRPLRATFVALWPQFAGGEHVRRSA